MTLPIRPKAPVANDIAHVLTVVSIVCHASTAIIARKDAISCRACRYAIPAASHSYRGGYIGAEVASMLNNRDGRVTVLEYMEQLLPGADTDLDAERSISQHQNNYSRS